MAAPQDVKEGTPVIGTAEQDAFVRDHKFAIVTTLRKDGSPTNSAIFVFAEGNDLVFSTTASRLKARTVENDPRIAVTVMDEGAPHRYVTVEGAASIQRNDIIPFHVNINRFMRGEDWQPPADFEEGLKQDGRLLIRVKPRRVSGVLQR